MVGSQLASRQQLRQLCYIMPYVQAGGIHIITILIVCGISITMATLQSF